MVQVVTLAATKGGTGKTSLALALAAGLTLDGHKVLALDLDRQGNFSFTAGATREGPTILGVLTGEVQPDTAIQHTAVFGDVIASSKNLLGADKIITGVGSEYRLKEALHTVIDRYDFVVIDTAPTIDVLLVNALTASNSVVIPVQASTYDLFAIDELGETIQPVCKYCNPTLRVAGIVLNMFKARTVMSREAEAMAEQLAVKLGTHVFRAKIREATAVRESQATRTSIFSYAPNSKVAGDYRNMVNEYLEGVKNHG